MGDNSIGTTWSKAWSGPIGHGAPDEGEAGQDVAYEPLQEGEEAGEQNEDGDPEEDPTHLPFAPSSELELLDDTTTVDPSYTISLIRKLLPQGSNVEKEFRLMIYSRLVRVRTNRTSTLAPRHGDQHART